MIVEMLGDVGSALSGVTVLVAALTGAVYWVKQKSSFPYGLSVTFDRAVGDPGFIVGVLNGRKMPIYIEAVGVIRASDSPAGRVARVIKEDRIHIDALLTLADVRRLHDAKRIEPGEYWECSTYFSFEESLPQGLFEQYQQPNPTPSVEAEVERLAGLFELEDPPSLQWNAGDKLVPLVLVPGVGYIFGAQFGGPFATGDVPPRECTTCGHDFVQHEHAVVKRRHRLLSTRTYCTVSTCGCTKYHGDEPPHGLEVRRRRI